jgi:cytochrome c oxidase cbb3-type subunit 4
MAIYSVLSSALTVIMFALFVGIVAWAWSRRRRQAFDDAANAPFALPDEPIRTATASRPPKAST